MTLVRKLVIQNFRVRAIIFIRSTNIRCRVAKTTNAVSSVAIFVFSLKDYHCEAQFQSLTARKASKTIFGSASKNNVMMLEVAY